MSVSGKINSQIFTDFLYNLWCLNHSFEKDSGMNRSTVGDVVENECAGAIVCSACLSVVYQCDR